MHSVKVASSSQGERRHVCNALILRGGTAGGRQREQDEAFPPSWGTQGLSAWGDQ